jgi:hypothetical protein
MVRAFSLRFQFCSCAQGVVHPSEEDLSLGTLVFYPSDEDLSLGTPVATPATKTCRWGPRLSWAGITRAFGAGVRAWHEFGPTWQK